MTEDEYLAAERLSTTKHELEPGGCDKGRTSWTGTALQRSGQLIFTEPTTK